ncbi:MAG TPA: PQQ-binding-like beta-propeller repeat protein [Acidimicrobiales bacterium]|nr:PQQ-binding-like beta-propeller repeat protein [Acidimicrobiales bacterium]
MLNHDLGNSRRQPAERVIGPAEAKRLRPAWSFDGADVGATGGLRTTPIVADGCVYLAFGQGYLGDRGDVVALDADTGELVWHVELEGSVLGLAAANGLIYATPSLGTRGDVALPVVSESYRPDGSSVVALDARTGERVWASERLDDGDPTNGTFINASPVPFKAGGGAGGRHLLFVPLAGGSGDGARVPMYFLDALTGATVRKSYSLTEAEYDAGFGGTGIWGTAAFDPATDHLYVGTADSDGHTRQHPYNNALLKIDADPRRATFASVVDSYSGTTEHADLDATIGYPHNPLCGALDDGLRSLGADVDLPTFLDTSASVECLELDFDFGASPNLTSDAAGRARIGALQKSGVYHSVDAASMTAAWTFFVGPGGAFMDAGTPAVGGRDVYVGATPNLVYGLQKDTGRVRRLATTGIDVFAYQPLTLANGVLYAVNDAGFLVGIDASSGAPLLHRLLAADGGFAHCLGVGAGVAVARNTVYAPCDAGGLVDLAGLPSPPGGLVAYR